MRAVLARIDHERTSTVARFLRKYGPVLVEGNCYTVDRDDGLIEVREMRGNGLSYLVGTREHSGDDFVEKIEAAYRRMLRDGQYAVPNEIEIWKQYSDSGIVAFPFRFTGVGS